MELHWLTATDDDLAALTRASALFDYPVRADWARRFVDQPNHHLCLAVLDGEPAGFVSGMEITHPDKGTEMLLYELGVDERFRRRGIGRALVEALAELATARGCHGMWVLTEVDDVPAIGTYLSAGAKDRSGAEMLTWRLDPTHPTFTDQRADS